MNNWQIKKLGELGNYINGYPFKPSEWKTEGLPIIRIQNLNNGAKEFNYFPGQLDKKYLVKNNDILISWSASLGSYIWERGDAWLNQHIFKVVVNERVVNKDFFFYLSQTVLEEMKGKTHGGTMKHITKGVFENISVKLPPLNAQLQIVEKLDSIRKLQELNQKEIEIIEELFSFTISNVFRNQNFKTFKLSEICDVRDGTHDSPKYNPQGIPLITSKNLKNDVIDFTNVNYISAEDHQQIIKRSFVENGDILFGMIGTIGNPVIVDTEREFSIKNVGLIKFPNKKIASNLFVKYFLQSPLLESEIKRLSRGGTQKFVSLGNLRNLIIPLPSLKEQEKIALELNNVRLFKSTLKKKEIKLSELFESTLNKTMKGELIN